MLAVVLFTIICSLFVPCPLLAFAASPVRCASRPASDSDAARLADFEDLVEDMDSMDFKDYFFEYLSTLTGPGVASSSNAEPADADAAVCSEVIPFDEPVLLSADTVTDYVNVLRFDVTINGTAYTLLVSPAYEDQLFVDADGYLWNIGTSNIQGRLFDGTFNPYATSGTLVYLTPCLGNNFSSVYNGGSPNYTRRYYRSGNGYTYTESYVRIHVDKVFHTFKVSDTLVYLIIFILLGGVLFLWLSRYRHY